MSTKTLFELRQEAEQADDHYRSELERVYGDRAHIERYRSHHDDPECQRAGLAKVAADKALFDRWEKVRND